jgi:hypothetical protein
MLAFKPASGVSSPRAMSCSVQATEWWAPTAHLKVASNVASGAAASVSFSPSYAGQLGTETTGGRATSTPFTLAALRIHAPVSRLLALRAPSFCS